ncbi:hypothetical protein [Cupriavidus sp. H39]|uniref:hypothetical protein n=1 Tax=Cupriavidus sp. H39 TaxID=3401635 RepID=UPI003D000EFD
MRKAAAFMLVTALAMGLNGFEALTAADPPYRKAKTLSEAVRIVAMAVAQQHLDPELFDLLLTSGVYRRYAEEYMRP